MQTNTKTTKKPVTWHIATNHLNLAYMTSIGMVPPISFLGNKYYHDCLAWFGDYIPLFNTVPQNIHEYNIDEDKRILKPCVLTLKKDFTDDLDKRQIKELPAFVNGSWQMIDIHVDGFHGVDVLLVPAPISLSDIEHVTFKNINDESIFLERLSNSANSLTLPIKKANERLFDKKNTHDIKMYQNLGLLGELPLINSLNQNEANAITAIINHLMILSNTNKKAGQLLNYIQYGKNHFDLDDKKEDELLKDIGDWVRSSGQYQTMSNTIGKVLLKLIKSLIAYKNNSEFSSAKDIILYTLAKISSNEQSLSFVEDMREHLRFANASTDDLLKKYPKPLQRSVILFISRDDVLELWQKIGIYEDNLSELDMLLASLLFAVATGWQGLPKEFKCYANKQNHSQKLFTQLVQNITIISGLTNVQEIKTPLSNIWFGDFSTLTKQLLLHINERENLDFVTYEIILPENIELSAKRDKVIIKTLGKKPKINHTIDEKGFLEYFRQMRWFDFDKDQQLQTIIKKIEKTAKQS